VASSRNVKEGDGYKEQTEWFRVTAWDKLAETCSSYLKKGSHVYIEGRLQTREWTDDQNQKRTTTEVILQEMTMLGSKADSESRQPAGVAAGGGYEGGEDETDIPF
jgi:single-strand DNA-binding protein